ncbi:MAG: deoxyguanosinetriphosphate triphosphohydrolase [Gammaproteobacteria bacterium]|nr:MAG: deoxyguanosinetriphosphate triphosphohydrolase [Gammaproteobacteria bacterium]
MDWHQLLSDRRLGKPHNAIEHDRTAFQKDVDRIIFSSAFRRLQDKTQVFPLAQNDYVRTRLTHSLEVSSVGRSLGTLVGKHITTGYNLTHVSAEDFGSIVAAACLAHDIGNPPFGHFGEEAIRAFFLERPIGQQICHKVSPEQRQDLLHFEGNAQGFRILTQLQNPDVYGGMQLTCATLGAFTKYPCTQQYRDSLHIAGKKNGLLGSDVKLFTEVADELGLLALRDNAWARHPLVYLMEAADDICYAIIDIEDAHQIKQLHFDKAYELLRPLAVTANDDILNAMHSQSDQLSYLRAKAIGHLVQEAVKVFIDNERQLLAGQYETAIADNIPSAKPLAALTGYAAENIYNCPAVVETQMAGHRILGDLLEIFCEAVEDVAQEQMHKANKKTPPHKAKAASRMLINLLPARFIGKDRQFVPCPYQRTLKVIDYVSGMTDSYAVSLYQKITGISI